MQTIFNLIPKLNIIYFKWISNNANQYFINIIFPATCTVVMNPINIKATYTQMLPAPSVRRSKIVFKGSVWSSTCTQLVMLYTPHPLLFFVYNIKIYFLKGRQSTATQRKIINVYRPLYVYITMFIPFIFLWLSSYSCFKNIEN